MRIAPLLVALSIAATPGLAASASDAPTARAVRYKVSGAAALLPSRIWEEGGRTLIVWPREAELPAVFSIGPDGHEVLADGAVREDRYVLDRIHTLLIFRIDQSEARARRTVARR